MIEARPGPQRGQTRFDGLESWHTFSFGNYHDPEHDGFGDLVVLNEDRVGPRGGFPLHGHQDMEIVSYVVEGSLEHKDSLGHGSVLKASEVQVMAAGTGVRHSESNPSPTDPVHFLQIWIAPDRRGIAPEYRQRSFPAERGEGPLRLVVSRDGRDGSLAIHQDADIYVVRLQPGQAVAHRLWGKRQAWVHVVRGAVAVLRQEMKAGDGAAIVGERAVEISAREPSELLLFDLAVR